MRDRNIFCRWNIKKLKSVVRISCSETYYILYSIIFCITLFYRTVNSCNADVSKEIKCCMRCVMCKRGSGCLGSELRLSINALFIFSFAGETKSFRFLAEDSRLLPRLTMSLEHRYIEYRSTHMYVHI